MKLIRRQIGCFSNRIRSRSAKSSIMPAWLIVPLLSLSIAGSVLASSKATGICDQAAFSAARTTGVPVSVLQAITRTETGRNSNGQTQPWPWTVNMEGKGVWFDTEDEARSYVFRHFKHGARSFDVGCFQINYKWHGKAFNSIDEMFNPQKNADYAARFLRDLYSEHGNWSDAAGAYHSRTPRYANKYKARFDCFRTRLDDDIAAPVVLATEASRTNRSPEPRVNTFPLLQAGAGDAAIGSLVQLGQTGKRRPLFVRKKGSEG